MRRIVGHLRRVWPNTRIVLRGDSGFCGDALMSWWEERGVDYLFGLARNARLARALGAELEAARRAQERTGRAARRFRDVEYRTRKSWTCARRVVGKAEHLDHADLTTKQGPATFSNSPRHRTNTSIHAVT